MALSCFSAQGIVPVEDGIVIKCRTSGIPLSHLSSHVRTSRKKGSVTRSSTIRFSHGDRLLSVSILVVDVAEGAFATVALFDGSSPSARGMRPVYARGFSVGESLSLTECVEALTDRMVSLLGGRS